MSDHSKHFSEPASVILFKGKKFQCDLFGEEQQLHESLHTRMQQFIVLQNDTSTAITLCNNFLGAVLLESVTLADAKALLPDILHHPYTEAVNAYDNRLMAKCWLETPTLSPEAINRFLERHKSPINKIKVNELNALTF